MTLTRSDGQHCTKAEGRCLEQLSVMRRLPLRPTPTSSVTGATIDATQGLGHNGRTNAHFAHPV